MAVQKQDDQHEHTFSNYVRIRDVVLKTCLVRWTTGRSGERGSGISVLPARHDDDDDVCCYWYHYGYTAIVFSGIPRWIFIFFIFLTFRPICPPICLSNSGTFTKLRTSSFITTIRIEPETSRWLSPLKLREPTPIDVSGQFRVNFWDLKFNILTWLELLLLCMIFTSAHIQIFFHLAFLIIGSHIVFNSILGLLCRSL